MAVQFQYATPSTWTVVVGVPGTRAVFLRWDADVDGRPRVISVHVDAEEVTTRLLREVPLQTLAAWIAPMVAAMLRTGEVIAPSDPASDRIRECHPTLEQLRRLAATPAAQRRRTWFLPPSLVSTKALQRARTSGSGEDFYREVAQAYNAAAATTSAPAKLLATDLGVSVKTVHRWVREARIAGALPPARIGAAG
jgi:hypothetical protein